MALTKLRTRRTSYVNSLNGMTLGELATYAQQLLETHGSTATLSLYSDYGNGIDYEVEWYEEESDEAFAARVYKHETGEAERQAKKAAAKAKREATRDKIDRALYEKLKSKFEPA
jgi:hypothetical protein